ncbi:hypothetical protein TRICI_000163, partial [Trichomonascus ciferrii]
MPLIHFHRTGLVVEVSVELDPESST